MDVNWNSSTVPTLSASKEDATVALYMFGNLDDVNGCTDDSPPTFEEFMELEDRVFWLECLVDDLEERLNALNA